MSIQWLSDDGWQDITGIASVAVSDPEPCPEGERMVRMLPEAYSASFTFWFDEATKAVIRAGRTIAKLGRHLEFVTTPRDRRIAVLHRHGRHLSAMRTAYHAKTKHRRRNR